MSGRSDGHAERKEMAKKYSCKNCGAELYFDPKSGRLHCDYCGSEYDPSDYDFTPEEEKRGDAAIQQESDAETGEASAPAEGESATDDSVSTDDLVVYRCPNCGAEVITSKKTVATTCVYCNRAITLTGNVSGTFRPDALLPFVKERKEVEGAYRDLCRRSFLTPRLFTSENQIKKIKGMYIPYWLYTFDGEADARIRAERVRVHMSGDDEVTETSRYLVHEKGSGHFQRIPADAMKEIDNEMMDSIEPFDFSRLVPFNPAYLAGFYAQQWDESSSANEPRAKARAKTALTEELMSHVGPFTTTMTESENYEWKNQSIEQVMIPVWMMYTEYRGKPYVFGMNGQTGKMMGTIPTDPGRLAEVGAAAFVIVQLILMLIRVLGV